MGITAVAVCSSTVGDPEDVRMREEVIPDNLLDSTQVAERDDVAKEMPSLVLKRPRQRRPGTWPRY